MSAYISSEPLRQKKFRYPKDPNRKAIPKKLREQVRDKFNGKCAYCGQELSQKWHADHLCPVYMKGTNTLENLMPACSACNNFKHSFTLEQFRRELGNQVERARKYSINFRNAEKFGLIQTTGAKVVFYFEKITGQEAP